jgi:hypothetical protein
LLDKPEEHALAANPAKMLAAFGAVPERRLNKSV